MVVCLRGWNADYADRFGPALFTNSQAQFNLTIPASYVPGDAFNVTFTGGLATEGTPPAAFATSIGVSVYAKSDGSPLDGGPFSLTGYSYAIGNTYVRFQPSTAASWTALGPGDAITAAGLGQTNVSANTLADGTPTAPGEGAVTNFDGGLPMIPVGWFPAMSFVDPPSIPIHTVSLHPGDVATIQFFAQSLANDFDHPTNSFYPYITSITVGIGSESLAIPLASVKTGFHLGATSVPWQVNGVDVAPWNAYGTVSGSKPPQAAVYQDLWLSEIGAPVQRGQGYIF